MIACLYVPLFPLAARLRSEPELKEEAVVICEGNGTAARVSSATRKARKVGIEPGMTLPQARARLPKLIARGRDAACERTAQQTLLEVAESFSPRVEDAGEGVVYMDLEGHPGLRARSAHLTPPDTAGLRPALPTAGGLPRWTAPPGGGRGDSFESSPQAAIPGSHAVILRSGATKDPGLDCEAGLSSSGSFPLAPLGVRMTAQGPLLGLTANGAPQDRGNAARPLTTTSDSHQPLVALARDILRAVEKAGLPGRVGVAASKLSARVAAALPDSPTVVAEGEEQAFLAPLPLARLAPEWETAALLDRWGLRTIGDFAKLPEGEVASRLGEGGRALHASARGIDPRPIEPYLPPPAFSEGMELEWPLASLEPFLFVAHTALTRLVGRLEAQALACTRLETVLTLDPDGHDTRAIQLPAPTRDVKTLLTLLRLDLEARPPGAAVAGFTFSAHPDQPRRAQLSLFGPAALSPDRLATTIARLAALLGADRVGSPRAQDGHRPERFTETGYAAPPPPPMRLPPRAGRGLLSVRVLRPPVPLEVIVEEPLTPTRYHRPAAGVAYDRGPATVDGSRRERGGDGAPTSSASFPFIPLPPAGGEGRVRGELSTSVSSPSNLHPTPRSRSRAPSASPRDRGPWRKAGGPTPPPTATTGTSSSPTAASTASIARVAVASGLPMGCTTRVASSSVILSDKAVILSAAKDPGLEMR